MHIILCIILQKNMLSFEIHRPSHSKDMILFISSK